jgi:hypothetical protein
MCRKWREIAKMTLEDEAGLPNDALMHPQSRHGSRRRRRSFWQNSRFKYIVLFMIIVALLVAGLMILMTSPSFVKPR